VGSSASCSLQGEGLIASTAPGYFGDDQYRNWSERAPSSRASCSDPLFETESAPVGKPVRAAARPNSVLATPNAQLPSAAGVAAFMASASSGGAAVTCMEERIDANTKEMSRGRNHGHAWHGTRTTLLPMRSRRDYSRQGCPNCCKPFVRSELTGALQMRYIEAPVSLDNRGRTTRPSLSEG
jgi:hypothetical protein